MKNKIPQEFYIFLCNLMLIAAITFFMLTNVFAAELDEELPIEPQETATEYAWDEMEYSELISVIAENVESLRQSVETMETAAQQNIEQQATVFEVLSLLNQATVNTMYFVLAIFVFWVIKGIWNAIYGTFFNGA